MNQLDLFNSPQRPPQIDGGTATTEDQSRAASSGQLIYQQMADGREYTLGELAEIGRCSEAGASARVRDFRKAKFKERYPCEDVEVRREGGLRFYRLVMGQDRVN